MKKQRLLLFCIIACMLMGGCRDGNKENNTSEDTSTIVGIPEPADTSQTTQTEEQIVIASGSGNEPDTATGGNSSKMPEYYDKSEETYGDIEYINTDHFTKRSFDLKNLTAAINNYLYVSEISAKVTKCVIDEDDYAEMSKKATLYFDDDTSRRITISWVYHNYKCYDDTSLGEDDDSSGGEGWIGEPINP